jgi:hypothetical protein
MTLAPLLLGIMARDEEASLKRMLPTLGSFPFHSRIALDTGSIDSSIELLQAHHFTVSRMRWCNNYSTARNHLLHLARLFGPPNAWLLILDPDEAMWPGDFSKLQHLCTYSQRDMITLPRINLADGGKLQEFGSYPDKQPRCLRLAAPIEFRNAVHEVVHHLGHPLAITSEGTDEFAAHLHIYHYGWCKSPAANWLRSHNYVRIAKGEPLLAEAPPHAHITYDAYIAAMQREHSFRPYNQPHPLP